MSDFFKKYSLATKAILFVIAIFVVSGVLVNSSLQKMAVLQFEATDSGTYYLGRIINVVSEEEEEYDGLISYDQTLEVKTEEDEILELHFQAHESSLKLKDGTRVVLRDNGMEGIDGTEIVDVYRTPQIIIIFIIFVLFVVAVAGIKGFTSLIGLAYAIAMLVFYVVPEILSGGNPLIVTLIASFLIGGVSIYFAHGFNKRATISLIGILITISVTIILAIVFVDYAVMTGQSSDEAMFLKSIMGDIDLKGLLLGGIVLGTLGVLDDVTAAQAAAVEELHLANPSLKFKELYKRAGAIGKEHIVSMVNTLVIAYIAASLPLLFLFVINSGQPVWVIFNDEFLMEEIVRSLVGSMALVFAVPVTTVIAAWSYGSPKANRM